MSAVVVVVALVALQRLMELPLAAYNTKRLKAQGAVEVGARHYPLFILLHASGLLALLCTTPADAPMNLWLLGLFLLLQCARAWVIRSLGPRWTTRVIVLPGAPLIKTGPYRFLRHPNYVIVAAEIAVLPLMFGNWQVALVWSALNAALLAWRVRVEDGANRPAIN